MDPGETPYACIRREMEEEMGLLLDHVRLFSREVFTDRVEYTFWKQMNLDVDSVVLTEGQRIQWFTEEAVRATPLAYGFNGITIEFFTRKPWRQATQEGVSKDGGSHS